MSRGDVCRANLFVGGRRPVVVITRDEAIPRLTSVLVVPVTRTICEALGYVTGCEEGVAA